MGGTISIKIIDNYTNTKNELASIKLRLEIIDKTEQLLKEEKEKLINLVDHLVSMISIMETHLKELTGIEHSLYYQIMVKGLSPTKAVDKVSFQHDKDVSTIWRNYYPGVKAKIEETYIKH